MANDLTIERSADTLTITLRTRRSGDSFHYVFGVLTSSFALLVLAIALGSGTLFDSWATIPLVLAGFAYIWFALTRIVNRRVLKLGPETLTVTDSPLPTLASGVELPLASIGKVTTRVERRWVPPIYWHRVSHVEAEGCTAALFSSISADDATRIRAAVVASLAGR